MHRSSGMSISEIYHIASLAKEKLLSEAEHKDHNLVRIVHHAQLYDLLLEKYHEEEDREEQEEEMVEKTRGRTGHTQHFEWIVEEESEEESELSDDDWDSDAESTSTVENDDAPFEEESKNQQGGAVTVDQHYSVVEVFEIELDEEDD